MEWVTGNKQKLQWVSFLLVILAFPVLTVGVNDGDTLMWVGMAMVVLGFAIPPLIRLLGKKEDETKSGGSSAPDGSAGPDPEAERKMYENRGQERPEGGG